MSLMWTVINILKQKKTWSGPMHLCIKAQDASTGAIKKLRDIPTFTRNHGPRLAIPTRDLNRNDSERIITCHELDSTGALHAVSDRIKKSSLCSSLGLLPRDLRKLDGTIRDQLPLVLVRDLAILVKIEFIKAIIKHDGIVFFEDPLGDQRGKQLEFLSYLRLRLRQSHTSSISQPFEFLVLESILQKSLQSLQNEFDDLQIKVEGHMKDLEAFVHWERLKILLLCRKRVCSFLERINNIRDCLKELLDSDADMANMYLSDKHEADSIERPAYDHEEMELLLESYWKIAEEISSRTQLLVNSMQATEDIVNIGLVGQRNELLLLDLRIGIGTFAASLGGFGASILGMNLPNGFEESSRAFYIVLGTLALAASTCFALVWRRLTRLIHLKR